MRYEERRLSYCDKATTIPESPSTGYFQIYNKKHAMYKIKKQTHRDDTRC